MLFAEHIGVYIREKLICWPEEEELLHINRYRIKKKRKYYHKNETLLLSKRKSYENAARPNRNGFLYLYHTATRLYDLIIHIIENTFILCIYIFFFFLISK